MNARCRWATLLLCGAAGLIPGVGAGASGAAWAPVETEGAASSAAPVHSLPSYVQVRAAWRPSDVRLLASNGTELQRVRRDFLARRGDWVSLVQISPALQRAVVRSEDSRFYDHGGVDWLASASAAWSALWGDGYRGASTLSMQLAALLNPALQRGPDGRGIWQKLDQMEAARVLEAHWTKAQILEAYLNLAAFRGEIVGVDALSRVLFQKEASGLTLRESALAAVLLRGPNASLPVLARRSCSLLRELGQPAGCEGLTGFIGAVLARAQGPRFGAPQWAPHWSRLLLDTQAAPVGAVLRSTLVQGLQETAVRSVRQHLMDLRGTGVTDAAVVVLDNRTGAVLAYVGSSAQLSAAADVDHARALRQAGSTLKPFLYGLALDERRLTAASLLDDRPVDLEGGSGLYVPDNYDHQFSGWVSTRTALASSLNVPAVRTLMLVSPDTLAQRLVALGLPLVHSGDYYGYSLALGSADVTLLSLTNAYRALARGGRYAPVALQAGAGATAQAGQTLFSPQATWVLASILSDREARARTFGLDSPLATAFWTAVKTGTSRDMRDNWCVGWSADYTVGVWVGNSEGASMRHVSGVTGAGPIWHDVFVWLDAHRPQREPQVPSGLTQRQIHYAQGEEPDRPEFFLGDTAQSVFSRPQAAGATGQPRIAEPVDGTLIALDPDIPPDHQRLRLRALDAMARPVVRAHWRVDGEAWPADRPLTWAPSPGQHVFELQDGNGRVLDRAVVIVRAAVQSDRDKVQR